MAKDELYGGDGDISPLASKIGATIRKHKVRKGMHKEVKVKLGAAALIEALLTLLEEDKGIDREETILRITDKLQNFYLRWQKDVRKGRRTTPADVGKLVYGVVY